MNRGILFGIIILLIGTSSFGQGQVKNGFLDLTENGFNSEPIVKLNGDWEFYWEKHLRPSDFASGTEPLPDIYGTVPAYWTNYQDQMPGIMPSGYATYRMRILLPEYFRNSLIFQVPVFDSSFRLYIDGKYVGSNGVPGQRSSETKPGYSPLEIDYQPVNDTIELIINVSNFHHRRGGFWLPMIVGTSVQMTAKIKRENSFTYASLGMLMAFTGFFFLFYIIFRRDRTMLYFFLTTLGIMIRTLFTGSYPILTYFNVQWIWLVRMEYTGSYLAFIFALLYFLRIYPDNFMRYVNAVVISLFGILTLIVLTTPVTFFSWSILVFMPLVGISLIYYSARSFITLFTKWNYEGLLALGLAAILIGAANDMMSSTSHQLISPKYILPHATLLFIMMQAIIMVYRWVHSSNEEKRLLSEIEFVNRNLENIVIERTTELTNQKGELEKQYELVESKNRELEKTITIKNRIFSIIAHDLKAPVLNLSLMIDHLRKNNDRVTFEKTTAALSQQSEFATTLIDNLLLWGEGQQNRIEYNPGIINLTDVILDNFNLLRENAEMKNISMSYSHRGDPNAICDRDLISIVVRNLLSNAIKYTGRKGQINVSVEEPAIKNGVIFIKVRDNGIGIPEDKIDFLFREDNISSTPGTENEKGTGLGLHLCHDLVRINKGTIEVESLNGSGTTFTVMLPAPTTK